MNDSFRPVRMMQSRQRLTRIQPDGYRMMTNPKGSKIRQWIVSRVWKWLCNSGALEPYSIDIPVYAYNEMRRSKVSDKIANVVPAALREQSRNGFSTQDLVICLGAADFEELMDGLHLTRPTVIDGGDFAFNMPRPGKEPPYRFEWRGVPVHVVPSMKGVVAIPRVIVEKTK